MIVGALGVAMAMHAHLQQKMDNIAVMKSLGATSRDIIGIYTIQTLMLGLVGGLAGVLVGRIVEQVFPLLIAKLFPMDIKTRLALGRRCKELRSGMLTTLLFTLPPLLAIRKIRPALILRRDMPDAQLPWRSDGWPRRAPALVVGRASFCWAGRRSRDGWPNRRGWADTLREDWL